jgi:hypothetical protein
MVGLGMVTLFDQPYALSQRKLLASEHMPHEIGSMIIDYIIGRPGRSADAWFPPAKPAEANFGN